MIFSIVWTQVNWTNISKVWWMDWLQKYFVLTMQVIVFKRNWIKERRLINRKFRLNLKTARFHRFVLAILLVWGKIITIYRILYKTFLFHFRHFQGYFQGITWSWTESRVRICNLDNFSNFRIQTCDSVEFQVTSVCELGLIYDKMSCLVLPIKFYSTTSPIEQSPSFVTTRKPLQKISTNKSVDRMKKSTRKRKPFKKLKII